MRFCTSLAELPGIDLAGRSIHGVRPASAVQGAAVQSNGAAAGGVAVPAGGQRRWFPMRRCMEGLRLSWTCSRRLAGGPLVWIDTPRKLTTEPEGSFSEIGLGTP
jgi:hypothetical protein